MAAKTCRLLNITDEQIEAIKIFINMNEWDSTIQLEIENGKDQESQEELGSREETSAHCSGTVQAACSANQSHSGAAEAQHTETMMEMGRTKVDLLTDPTLPMCDQCFLQPCVIHYRQGWLSKPKAPQATNRTSRRRMYKKFWSVMDYRGGWQEPMYLRKKKTELERAGYLNETTVWETAMGSFRREIMPDCVVQLKRSRYPNPPDLPYSGHR